MDLGICIVLTAAELSSSTIAQWRTEGNIQFGFSRFLSLLLLQYALAKFYRIYAYPRFFSPLRHLPGPKNNHIIFGQELNKLRADNPIAVSVGWCNRWPSAPFIRYLSVFGREVLVVNNIMVHRDILQTHAYDFVKPPFFANYIGEMTGIGLLFAQGDHHRRQRKLLAGPFAVPSIRNIVPVFRDKAQALSRELEEKLGDKPYASIETMETFARSTMETVGVTVLGIELSTLSATYPFGFQELWVRLLHQDVVGQLISVLNAFVPGIGIRRFIPLKANKWFMHASGEIRRMLREIVEKRSADLRDGTFEKEIGQPRDLLTYMLEESEVQRRQTGRAAWTVDEVVDHLLNFTSAGHETSAGTLSWALYTLATRHELQDRLRAEVQAMLGDNPEPTYDQLNALPYLHNFVREVLRLYSPSFLGATHAIRDVTIQGVHIPKGTQIEAHTALIHHNHRVWGLDAEEFDPTRWDSLEGDRASPYAFEAFSQGPRICPGKNFAMAQIKATLVELIGKWRFIGIERAAGGKAAEGERELLTGGEETLGRGVKVANPALTYRPDGDLWVRFGRL